MRRFDRWFFGWPGASVRWLCRLVALPGGGYLLYLWLRQLAGQDEHFALFMHTPLGVATWVSTIVCLLYLIWDMAKRESP